MTDQIFDRYAVVGNPVAHSKSPWIHAQFAKQTSEHMAYERLLSPLDGFVQTVRDFQAGGGRGLNVTVPFKFEACAMAHALSQRVAVSGAANTLSFRPDGTVYADNTDGPGLVADLLATLGNVPGARGLQGLNLLILGAGGAVAGVLPSLIDAGVASIVLLNRTASKAYALVERLRVLGCAASVRCVAGDFTMQPEPVDVVINGTSASLAGECLAVADDWFSGAQLAYDMMYAPQLTPFLAHSKHLGVDVKDGLGMLVEQAAESFFLWRGVRPNTRHVLTDLRQLLSSAP